MSEQMIFDCQSPLPSLDNGEGVVHWHAFRLREQAEAFLPSVRLAEGQNLVGGYTEDSVGVLWWVGVRVDDVDRWGNRQAVNKHAVSD